MPAMLSDLTSDYETPTTLKTLTAEDAEFIHAAAWMAKWLIENAPNDPKYLCRVNTVITDILSRLNGAEATPINGAQPLVACCSSCAQLINNPVQYLNCITTCIPSC